MSSSTASQSLDGNASRNAFSGIAARSSVRTWASAPPKRPIGVRIPSQMNADATIVGVLPYRTRSPSGRMPDRGSGIRLGLNANQLNLKDERGIGTDDAASAAFSVSQIGGHDNLPLGTHGHELQHFLETGNHIFHFKRHRFPGLFGTIELRSVHKRSLVVAKNCVGFRRLFPIASR